MLTLDSLTHYSNVLELTNRHHFLNTTTVLGACYTPGNWCSRAPGISGAVMVDVQPSYFSGYVFRGDTRPPNLIFEDGFELQLTPGDENTRARTMIGAVGGGATGIYGISTSVCVSVCAQYSLRFSRRNPRSPSTGSGYVYLIDATEFKGFAIPAPDPNERVVIHNPILRDIYEVNFASNIPGSYIVGIVWPLGKIDAGMKNCRCTWPFSLTRIWLAVNPNFRKPLPLLLSDGIMEGMEAAKQVQAYFNERHSSHLLGLP
ncbi:hypothetical protein [Endozoicomonas euniceicola]|uniref:Uncharacterized protein n=1 Tax=Endozoicomonas euniceicola TaxID=1234143 RepID=A0ABY6GZ13_9GAMM|nr:hypothetical protein [Endozoicomonas euniceicola]UYM17291.1 hypothetical protein NX720_05035 [Endozoicomonas euniceicola]